MNFLNFFFNNNKLERIWIIAKNDFIKRYYGTSLGVAWAFVHPLFEFCIYYFVFTLIFPNSIENFALHLFSGLLIWQFFSESTRQSITILRDYNYLISNIQIQKLDLFWGTLLSKLFALTFNFTVYFMMSLFFNINYTITVFLFPIFILNLCTLILAVSLLLAVLNIYFRDIVHLWDMMILLLFWASPIFYGKEAFQKIPTLLYINPLAGIFINFRDAILYQICPDIHLFLYGWTYSFILLVISLLIFKKFSHKAIELL
ncbi:ABC-2 type transporter [Candidatus Magnetomorum sp. HK-1]|nr:ABC-2 type transporter [Candidatus Magnetomorum sp. HK-1]